LTYKYKKEFNEALSTLLADKIITIPTDTYYGLACNALDEKIVHKLFKLKKRDINKPVPVLISDENQLDKFNVDYNGLENLINCFWPGPLTLVLKTNYNFPEGVIKNDGYVGFRIPDLDFTRELIRTINKPLTGTSANISGLPETKDVSVIHNYFKKSNLGKITDISCGNKILPSTVVKVDGDLIKLLREGSISKTLIESKLGENFRYE